MSSSTLAYDLSTFALKDCIQNVVIFNHVASRQIDITEGLGWVETAPSQDVTASFTLNGSPLSGASVTITSGGVVTVTMPATTLNPGDQLQAVMNADADVPATKASGVAITLVATNPSSLNDVRYDAAYYIEGMPPAGRTIAAAVAPRQFHLKPEDFQGTQDINASNLLTFDVRRDGVSIASIVCQPNGAVLLLMTNKFENFAKGEVLSIFSPGTLGNVVDATMADVSFTIKGILGPG